MPRCVIFGALSVKKDIIDLMSDDYIIAADAGLITLKKYNIIPDLILGDFDSLDGEIPVGENVIRHPIKKDDTDTLLAVKMGFEKGFKEFVFYGCLGERLDHTLANIQTASYIAENGGNSVFISEDILLTVVKNKAINFTVENEGNISVFAVSGNASGVNIKNLLYELNNAIITPDFPIGVSNEFINKPATISVRNGKLCIVWSNKKGAYFSEDINNE